MNNSDPSVTWLASGSQGELEWRYRSPMVDGVSWLDWIRAPEAWIGQSHNLHNAARLLEAHIFTYDPLDDAGRYIANFVVTQHMMLCGMALECMFKARYLQRGGPTTNETKGFRFVKLKGSRSHNLVEMAESPHVGVELNTEQRDLLQVLSWAIQFGRYPAFLDGETNKQALGVTREWSKDHVRRYEHLRSLALR